MRFWLRNWFVGGVIVICPSYDRSTEWLSGLFGRWLWLYNAVHLGRAATRDVLLGRLIRRKNNQTVVLFAGHGYVQAILTAPKHSVLFGVDDLKRFPNVHLVAWCCSAGGGFAAYVRNNRSGAVLGFSGKLLMVIGADAVWGPMIRRVFRHVGMRGRVDRVDELMVKTEIDAAMSRVNKQTVEGRRQEGVMNRMCLIHARELVISEVG